MRRRHRLEAATAALTGAIALAGCGSTAQRPAAEITVGGSHLSVGAPAVQAQSSATNGNGSGPAGPAVGQVHEGPASGTSSYVATSTGGPQTGTDASGHPVTFGAGALRNAPGVTADRIYIGVVYQTNGDAANAAIGAAGVTQGDTRADANAVIDEVNAHGGIAGRKVVPVWYADDATSTDTYAHQDQQECAAFTQDHHIFVSLDIGYTDTFMTCMRNAGIVMLYSGDILDADNGMFRQYPNFYDIGTMSQDRYMADLVRSLVRQDYFSGWNTALGRPGTAPAKVGIVSAADASWERPLDHVLLPALAAAGHPVSPQNIVRVPDPNSQSDQGPGVSAVTAAELRFAQQGVTHVILLDNRGGLTLIFSNAARSQHYHPRYALNSGMGVQALHDSDAIATDQLNGAVGVGWQPSVDLPAAAGNAYATPATKQCLDIMKRRTGQTYDSTNAASLALDYCDQMFFLRDAIDHAGPVLTEQTVTAAIDAIHGSFTPAVIPRAYVSAARHDAAQLAWDMYWDGGCTCVKYRNEHVVP